MNTGVLLLKRNPDEIINAIIHIRNYSIIFDNNIPAQERVNAAIENNSWKGDCLFVVNKPNYSMIENLSGFMGGFTKEEWQLLATINDFEFLEYNDSIQYAQYILAKNKQINEYYLFEEKSTIIKSGTKFTNWIDIAGIIDERSDLFLEDSIGRLIIMKQINKTAPNQRLEPT
jgi:hypothetical protein